MGDDALPADADGLAVYVGDHPGEESDLGLGQGDADFVHVVVAAVGAAGHQGWDPALVVDAPAGVGDAAVVVARQRIGSQQLAVVGEVGAVRTRGVVDTPVPSADDPAIGGNVLSVIAPDVGVDEATDWPYIAEVFRNGLGGNRQVLLPRTAFDIAVELHLPPAGGLVAAVPDQ